MRDLMLGILPLLGVALGILLQHWMGNLKYRNEHFTQIRHQTYSDYLKSVAEAAKRRNADAITSVADAEARIAVYGSTEVVTKLSAFEAKGANLSEVHAQDRFLELAQQIRAEANASESLVADAVLATVLFGQRPS